MTEKETDGSRYPPAVIHLILCGLVILVFTREAALFSRHGLREWFGDSDYVCYGPILNQFPVVSDSGVKRKVFCEFLIRVVWREATLGWIAGQHPCSTFAWEHGYCIPWWCL